jgi:hypothetical protein
MPFGSSHEQQLDALQGQLRDARVATPEVMADAMARTCFRLHAQDPSANASVVRLIESRAFTDAVLMLLELELPQWKLRRLIREDGEWHCALSKQPGLPAELDDMAEGHHESLPLAILSAFVEARRASLAATAGRPTAVPQILPAWSDAVCCDNFR